MYQSIKYKYMYNNKINIGYCYRALQMSPKRKIQVLVVGMKNSVRT